MGLFERGNALGDGMRVNGAVDHSGELVREVVDLPSGLFGGWFVGHFVGQAGLRETKTVEVKYSVHTESYNQAEFKSNVSATTLVVLVAGQCHVDFCTTERPSDVESCVLTTVGDYVIWPPEVFHRLVVTKASELLSVRWPSAPDDQRTLTELDR